MMRILSHILYLLTAALIAGCTSGTDEPPAPPCERAILIYMVANNSLGSSSYDNDDITEMTAAAKNGDLGNSRLILYHHPYNGTPVLKEISGDGVATILIEYDSSVSSVSSARMKQVFADFKRLIPAERRGLILWSHGNGWLQDGIEDDIASPLSFGDDRRKKMNITTLAATLDGEGFDYLYFDCCHMASVEVAYELRHAVPWIIGSATELPAPGMPYDLTLKYLAAADADLEGAAETTFNYYNEMRGSNRTCTISLIRTSGLDRLAASTFAIYRQHPSPDRDFTPQEFMRSDNTLYDFRQYIEALGTDPALLEQWQDALDDVVVYKNATPYIFSSLRIVHHCGLSTYILSSPADAANKNYRQLRWYSDVASALFR